MHQDKQDIFLPAAICMPFNNYQLMWGPTDQRGQRGKRGQRKVVVERGTGPSAQNRQGVCPIVPVVGDH